MTDIATRLRETLGPDKVLIDDAIGEDYHHDESLGGHWTAPIAVVRPVSAADVVATLALANETGTPVTVRGTGTGLSGASIPIESGILISFERMNNILEIDEENFLAIVEPGVQLDQLDAELAPRGLAYAVYPGEYSASLGGNISTNAGGMRAVKYGVTRNNVLGLEAVLPTGEVIHTGGRIVKVSTGYDLTQLIIGSEGTLAVVTQAVLRLVPRPKHSATILAPFETLDAITAAIPRIVDSGIGPNLLEYLDMLTMAATTYSVGLNLGIPDQIKETAAAYLVVGLDDSTVERLDQDVEICGELLGELGAMDLYVLEAKAAAELITARERTFWVAKAAGADDIVDTVVPRASVPVFMAAVQRIAAENETFIPGCGHAGDGNVHLGVFQKNPEIRARVMHELFRTAMELGGAISGEHGIGTEKKKYLRELEDPAKLALMGRIKAAFDPNNILNPGKVFD